MSRGDSGVGYKGGGVDGAGPCQVKVRQTSVARASLPPATLGYRATPLVRNGCQQQLGSNQIVRCKYMGQARY